MSTTANDPVVIAIDAGTTGVRSMVFDADGSLLHSSYREFAPHFPQPGWVEHDATEIWDVTQVTLGEVVAATDRPIAGIGITDQRETVVAWDRTTGEVLHRAIVWQDRRTAARCDELVAAGELPRVRETTGLVLDPYFSGTKIEWLIRHGGVEPRSGVVFGTIDSWLLWNLTGGVDGGVFATDPSNASRTLLYDIRELAWSGEMCGLLGVPIDALPEVRPSAGRFGTTAASCAAGAGIPVSGIAGDQQSALFGQACFQPGMTKNTYGTGSFVLMNVGSTCPPPVEGLLTTVAWTIPGELIGGGSGSVTHYALEGAIFVTGAAVQWLRDGLEVISEAAETGPLAESVDDTGGVVMVPAFTGLGSPWWDPYARGTIVGLTRGTTRAHLARAAVEAMAFQTRDVVDAMCDAAGQEVAELRVDGGAAAMDLLLQLQADQLRVPVIRPTGTEVTAQGAAYLAGLAEGVWGDIEDVTSRRAVDATFQPKVDEATADAAHAQWLRAVERARAWVEA